MTLVNSRFSGCIRLSEPSFFTFTEKILKVNLEISQVFCVSKQRNTTCPYYLTDISCFQPTCHTTERSRSSAANLVNNQIYNFLSIFALILNGYIAIVIAFAKKLWFWKFKNFAKYPHFAFWLPVSLRCRLPKRSKWQRPSFPSPL